MACVRGGREVSRKEDAARYRERALRLRVIAANEREVKNRELLEQIASEYERLAFEEEQRPN